MGSKRKTCVDIKKGALEHSYIGVAYGIDASRKAVPTMRTHLCGAACRISIGLTEHISSVASGQVWDIIRHVKATKKRHIADHTSVDLIDHAVVRSDSLRCCAVKLRIIL